MTQIFPIGIPGNPGPASPLRNLTLAYVANQQMISDQAGDLHTFNTPKLYNNGRTLAVAAAGSVTVSAASALQKYHMQTLTITISVAGEVLVIDNATTIGDFFLAANIPFVMPLPIVGYAQIAFNTALTIKNNSAGAMDITWSSLGVWLQ